ncbi:hypothetical protein Dret_1550 [Desulfohalobium retbaense DSM 5692]|uniref:Uncharacterized protein n=1 Tax=Desulfohalobium retbaense (strain ATCC 49708 / DSM 5692 / JCM 16813 / HR100) TaxID=485915 RepID=C8X337_DESRD|nr:hypothetical protein Dret_1550 [Desulfohalobium retbaense DSM 5692]
MRVQCIRLLGFSFFGIEIAIGIGIDAGGRFILSLPALYRILRLADNQHILTSFSCPSAISLRSR